MSKVWSVFQVRYVRHCGLHRKTGDVYRGVTRQSRPGILGEKSTSRENRCCRPVCSLSTAKLGHLQNNLHQLFDIWTTPFDALWISLHRMGGLWGQRPSAGSCKVNTVQWVFYDVIKISFLSYKQNNKLFVVSAHWGIAIEEESKEAFMYWSLNNDYHEARHNICR